MSTINCVYNSGIQGSHLEDVLGECKLSSEETFCIHKKTECDANNLINS